jgi:hypothetical protein
LVPCRSPCEEGGKLEALGGFPRLFVIEAPAPLVDAADGGLAVDGAAWNHEPALDDVGVMEGAQGNDVRQAVALHAVDRARLGPWVEHDQQAEVAAGHTRFDALVNLVGDRVSFVEDKQQMRGVLAAEFGLSDGRIA